MKCKYEMKMWESLPPIILSIIFEHVDLKTKLSASATCQNWREALFNPRCKIHEKLHLKFHCRPPKFRVTDEQRDRVKCFIKHTRCLILDWCDCNEDLIINILGSVDGVNHITEQVKFHAKGRYFGCSKKPSSSDSCNTSLTDTLIHFMNVCKNLKNISLGSNTTLCQNKNVVDAITLKLKSKKLTDLNISYMYRIGYDPVRWLSSETEYKEAEIEFKEAKDRLFSLISNDNLLITLKEISITWDENFEDILSNLAVCSGTIEILGLLVENSGSYRGTEDETRVTELWKQLKIKNPQLKVKINLTEIRKGKIRAILDKEMPLTSLCVVYSSEEFAEIVIDNLRNTDHGSNLKEIGFHYVEGLHFKPFFNPAGCNSNYSNLITHLDSLNHIRQISWSGQFVLDTDILFLITQHASTLQSLLMHKHEVVCESRATREYFIPLSEAKVYGLEKSVSTIWGKPWKMLRDLPVQRIPRRGICYDYVHQEEMFWVLQNKGF